VGFRREMRKKGWKKDQKTGGKNVNSWAKYAGKGQKHTRKKGVFGAQETGKCVWKVRKSDRFWQTRDDEKCILYWFFPGRPF
jgi:hypothetical protein